MIQGFFFNTLIPSNYFASGGQGTLFEKTAPWTPVKTFNYKKGARQVKFYKSLIISIDMGVVLRQNISYIDNKKEIYSNPVSINAMFLLNMIFLILFCQYSSYYNNYCRNKTNNF